jgi:hypothetical protein
MSFNTPKRLTLWVKLGADIRSWEVCMTRQSNPKKGKQQASAKEVPLFRSDISSLTVEDATLRVADLASLRRDPAKVSALRLEQYLNPCNPICSG